MKMAASQVLGKDGVRLWRIRNALSTKKLAQLLLALIRMKMAAAKVLGKDGVPMKIDALATPTVVPFLAMKMAASRPSHGVRLWGNASTPPKVAPMNMVAIQVLGKDGVGLWLNALPTPTLAPILLTFPMEMAATQVLGKDGVRLRLNALATPTVAQLLLVVVSMQMAAAQVLGKDGVRL
jgi:hypothetical protein